jgi:Flp pilus assembly pilin Flp
MMRVLNDLALSEDGGTMVEYGIIAALLAVPSLAVLIAIANNCGTLLNNTGTGLTKIGTTNP